LRKHGLSVKDRFFVYLGGVNPHKNLPMLSQCFAKIQGQERFSDTKLVIIGDITNDGFTPGLPQLKKSIEELNISDRVIFTGFVPDQDAVHFLNVARAVVLPSFAEGFGLPAIEGAACGTPAIATRNSPLPDLLFGGGVFVDPREPEQLLAAMQHLLEDDVDWRDMGNVARKRAEKLTWQNSATQMQSMLSTIEDRRS
jgi:glycosyltransferase involved in cell wall biosynthesis